MTNKIKKLLSLRDSSWRFPGPAYNTFRALYALASYDKKLLEGEPLGKISALLISLERAPGGPYYSEFPDSSGKNPKQICDQKTNEAISRFLSIYDVELPNVSRFLGKRKIDKKIKNSRANTPQKYFSDPRERAMVFRIRTLLRVRLSGLPADFRRLAIRAVERTIRGNPDKQMSLMPYYMKIALGKKAKKILPKTVVSICLANIFFWTAFIIYDDFWDEDEAADSRLLPVANLFARSYTAFFSRLFRKENGFNGFFHRLMDELDGANAWETIRCRAEVKGSIFEIPDSLPNYGDYVNKYRPASGHILGPLALLMFSGYKINSSEARYLTEYFRHYLIAMQMNDDMHDWEEDLRRGHISTALDMLLRDFQRGKKGKKTIHLEKDMKKLRMLFWFTTLPKLARKAVLHAKKSRVALKAMKSLSDPAPLLYFIDFNQRIAEKAIKEQKQSLQFLNAYGKSYAR